jgi:hypothetical protein
VKERHEGREGKQESTGEKGEKCIKRRRIGREDQRSKISITGEEREDNVR